MSRLGLGLGITKGGVIPFNPLSLDPYLLFDTQSSMIGTFENPTLDLDPSVPSTLDVITATRAGVATYTDADGLIQSATPNTVRVDQTQGAELTPTKFQRFINTEFNQAYWSFSSQMGNPVYNYDTAPNGEQEATRIVSNGGSYPQIVETIEGLTIGQQYTASFYVKSDGTSQIQQATHFTGLSGGIGFTPTDNWERASYTITATATTHSFVIFTNGSSTPASSYLIWGPQLEEGTTASSFVANTTGSPKFIASATYGPRVPMILVEPSATNLVTYSEDFSQSSWDKQSGGTGVAPAITSNDTIAPDGTQSADKVVFNKGAADDPSNYSILSDAFPSQQNTASLFIKADTNQRIVIRNSSSWVAYDVTTEWTRIEQTDTGGSLQIGLRDGYGIPNVPDTATVYLWGAQVEAGSVATSYIPTSGGDAAARTRPADDLVITGSDFTDFYNQSEGTFYAESNTRLSDGQPFIVSVDNGDNNRIILYNATTSVRGFVKTSGSTQADFSIGTRPSANTLNRIALSYKTNNVQGSLNGGSVITDTSVSIATSINRMNIGTRYNQGDANKLNGHIKRLIYWPYHSDSL